MPTRTPSGDLTAKIISRADLRVAGMSVASAPQVSLNQTQAENRQAFRWKDGRPFTNPTPALDIGGYLNYNPKGSLRDIVVVGDTLRLGAESYEVKRVKDRSVEVTRGDTSTRLVVERSKDGLAVGLKESGKSGRRASF